MTVKNMNKFEIILRWLNDGDIPSIKSTRGIMKTYDGKWIAIHYTDNWDIEAYTLEELSDKLQKELQCQKETS